MTGKTDVFDESLASKGFVKTTGPDLDSAQRVALIRKGNELFNSGRIEDAKRVFITTHYTDGLIRLGDHYTREKKPLEAFRMYWLAPDRTKIDYILERMANVVREWLREDT